ncbi:MAG TPA: adenylosuccinate synthetase, partial [Planctomycetota bacterium]|nr:adenylosuccinate synthetase [Planctomycetota bacterium]
MSTVVVVGTQWGDEAKAKVVDLLSEESDVVVRSQGGNNAGHTVVVGREKFILHLVPCGVLRPGVVSVIGNGVVVDPKYLLEEMADLRARGVHVTPERLILSERAHLILPYHRLLDTL